MSDTSFGVAYPTGMEGLMYPVPFCDETDLVELAVLAEDLGFDSIGANDHIVTQQYVAAEWEQWPNYYDLFTTLAFAAAHTDDLVLNTAVTVLPMRDPVWVAKQAATLDVLSGGRVLLGCGIGAYREEFEAIEPDATSPRGRIMDEALEAVSDLLAGGATTYDGEHVRFEGVDLHPRPAQDPLPVYVGGNHPNALERTVKWGHGWLPAGMAPEELDERIDRLEELCEAHGRDPADIEVAPQLVACIDDDPDKSRTRFRESQVFKHLESLADSTLKGQALDEVVETELIGTPEQIIEKVEAYRDAGVTRFPAIIFAGDEVAEVKKGMELFAEDVMPAFD
jgi:probable F420-dependent oxidoreductase